WAAVKGSGKTIAEEISESLERMFGVDAKPTRFTFAGGHKDQWMAWVNKGEDRIFKTGELDVIELIEHHGKNDLKPKWKGLAKGVPELIELINFALALRHFRE